MRVILIVILAGLSLMLKGQEQDADYFRSKGYEARQAGDFNQAIRYYSKVLQLQPKDYDAHLALGRLFYRTNQCDSSSYYFQRIYQRDSSDVEALMGLSRCNIRTGKLSKAIAQARNAVLLQADVVPAYHLWAKALSFDGQLDEAIKVYHKAIRQDSSWSQSWAGIGKMYYWKAKPVTALMYYKKALKLDPDNEEIKDQLQNIQNEIKFNISAQAQYLQEVEETYKIDAFIQKYQIKKRLTDSWELSANILLDYSNRDFTTQNDTIRWFDNTWLKANWMNERNRLSVYLGASSSDQRLTTYGLSWHFKNKTDKIIFENTLDAGYHYFYYWNKVGRKALSNKVKLDFRNNITASLNIQTGYVDQKAVHQYRSEPLVQDVNGYFSYHLSGNYQIIDDPDIKLGINHSYFDYQYLSPAYYTPNDRFLTGLKGSLYHQFHSFYLYGMYAYHLGSEKYYYLESTTTGSGNIREFEQSGTIDADNWSASLEVGYQGDIMSFSIGSSRFYNPYYENFTAFFKITGLI